MLKLKVLLTGLIISLISPLSAQIIIQKPQIDYTKSMMVKKYFAPDADSVLSAMTEIKGQNRVWDFTVLEFDTSALPRKTEFLDGAALKGVSEFKDISLIISETFEDTMKFSLYILSDTLLQTVAELSNKKDSVTIMDLVYSPPVTSAVFPLEYGVTRNFNSVVNFSDFKMSLEFEFTVDGWGELVTPIGKEKVLRIKLGGSGEFVNQQITVNNYLFVTGQSVIIPVAEIQEIVYGGVSTYSASYRKFY